MRYYTPSATTGTVRYNTTLGWTEEYDGVAWTPLITPTGAFPNQAAIATTSGTHITSRYGQHRSHYFLSGYHTFTPSVSGTVEVLVVAGGGGASAFGSGGGGGGGVIYSNSYLVAAGQAYPVFVGQGGEGGIRKSTSNYSKGQPGTNSIFGFGSSLLNAIGGGTSGNDAYPTGFPGGSGGGAGTNAAAPQNSVGGAATAGQGFPGGAQNGTFETSAGGGGAGGAGFSNTDGGSGNLGRGRGGAGVYYSISGIPTVYSAGGGGGNRLSATGTLHGGLGGSAGAGRGSGANFVGQENAVANTGCGGGGARGFSDKIGRAHV
jgi:hypothetical protein